MKNKNPQIIIMSKKEIENFAFPFPKNIKYAVISISGDIKEDAEINDGETDDFIFATHVNFDDVEKPQKYYNMVTEEYEELFPMTSMQARILAYDVKRNWNKIDVLIVQCNAGISRSAGVAAAIAKHFYNDDKWIFNSNKYRPNMKCYQLMLRELEETK